MGPIELAFLVIIAIFGVVGVVRGYTRELGVTLILLFVLFVIKFIEAVAPAQFNSLLGFAITTDPAQQDIARGVIWAIALIITVFAAYHGETLVFPGSGKSTGFSLFTGLLNGYLFAGSLWFFLGRAGWPFLGVSGPYTTFYNIVWRTLPPNVLIWQFLLALVVLMVMLRVWK